MYPICPGTWLQSSQIETEDKGYAKVLGVNKVHYGLCENDKFEKKFSSPSTPTNETAQKSY